MVNRSLQALPKLVYTPTVPLHSKCRPSLFTWVARNTESQTLLQVSWIRICIFPRFPEDSHGLKILRSLPADSLKNPGYSQPVYMATLWPQELTQKWEWFQGFQKDAGKGSAYLYREPEEGIAPLSLLSAVLSRYDSSLTKKVRLGRGKSIPGTWRRNLTEPYLIPAWPLHMVSYRSQYVLNILTDSFGEAIS